MIPPCFNSFPIINHLFAFVIFFLHLPPQSVIMNIANKKGRFPMKTLGYYNGTIGEIAV